MNAAPLLPDGSLHQGGRLLHNLLLFGRMCRALGMAATPNRMIEVARALGHIDLGQRLDVYHAMRALIVSRQRDLELFDRAFELFWTRPVDEWTQLDMPPPVESEPKRMKFLLPPGATPEESEEGANGLADGRLTAILPTWSTQEQLRYKDFSEMSQEELALAKRVLEKLPRSLDFRRTRRLRPGKGSVIDLRRALRHNLRHAGEYFTLPTRAPGFRPRPLVLICDISGSMERYTRIFLHFMHTFASGMQQVESFVFSVHLTRITRQIRHKSIDRALADVGSSVSDWGSGTRTGEALRDFNYRWARRVLGRGAMVLIITDGWDRGDPLTLQHEMERLQLSCHRLIWLNPLLDLPRYEPLTRGAKAMLPFTDDFLPLRNLDNLETVVQALHKLAARN